MEENQKDNLTKEKRQIKVYPFGEYSIGNASEDGSGKQLMDQDSAIDLQHFVIFFIKDSSKTGLLYDAYSYDSDFGTLFLFS